ncbi:TolC family protein [Adhaeribacter radiodurans]|uniref:TolC family protein n=1 Tax=Adhaeribacter radiodurans TaxID=2745197 RepID=A0A7L7LCI5_9BACT|nr:TolC family protein [Adhaeribacter radiodurans]QMU30457.1 TolC family protein [Adhaeribacter radiodurans]
MKCWFVFLPIMLLVTWPCCGQKQFTLDDCYQIALENNIAVKQAQNDINSNALDRKTAQYSLLPSLAYSVNHYFSFGKNIDPVTNDFVFERFSGGSTGLDLNLELFSGLKKLNTIKQSAFNLKSAGYAKKRTELEVLSNITLSYARLLLDKEQATIARNNILTTTKTLAIIQEKIKTGRLTKYEHYTFNARLNSEKADLITVLNDSLLALQELKQFLNISYKDYFTIAAIDTSLLADIYNTSIVANEFVESVIQTHPAIKQAQMNEQVARLGVKVAKSSLLPSLSAGGNLVSNYNSNEKVTDGAKIPINQQLNDNLGQNIGISLDIPIFSKKEFINSVKKEKINVSNAQLATKEAENAVINNTLQFINEFNSAKQKYKATLAAWQQNSLSYNLYAEKYKLGQISSVELLTARDILNASAANYLQSKLQLFFRYQLLLLLKAN